MKGVLLCCETYMNTSPSFARSHYTQGTRNFTATHCTTQHTHNNQHIIKIRGARLQARRRLPTAAGAHTCPPPPHAHQRVHAQHIICITHGPGSTVTHACPAARHRTRAPVQTHESLFTHSHSIIRLLIRPYYVILTRSGCSTAASQPSSSDYSSDNTPHYSHRPHHHHPTTSDHTPHYSLAMVAPTPQHA